MQLEEMIIRRISYLEKLIAKKQASIEASPTGSLRISKHRDSWQYYYRDTPDNKNGKYIRKSEVYFAQSLAQRDYDISVITNAKSELNILKQYTYILNNSLPESVFSNLPSSLQKLINPIHVSDEEYIKRWLDTPYEKKAFDDNKPAFYTDDGLRVRSKSEVIIANELSKLGIPFLYEKPLFLAGYGIVHPDFTLLDLSSRKEIYYEHFGMMDDRYYSDKVWEKINSYERNGYYLGDSFIASFETYRAPLNTAVLSKKLALFYKERGYSVSH